MRKRRRLANKMTIMVCAVLCAVSAFFYAPMDVSAEDLYSGTVNSASGNVADFAYSHPFSFGSFDDSVVYKLDYTVTGDVVFDTPCYFRAITISYGSQSFFTANMPSSGSGSYNVHSFNYSSSIYLVGSVLNSSNFIATGTCIGLPSGFSNFTSSLSIIADSITPLFPDDSASYQQGYNAGYSAGEQAGYGNGYSQGFTDGEASVDTDAIYDEAFQAGKDSVDTQSYYDAGYQAGYQVAYSEGYESGYDVGYQSAMDRIANWGADTSDYPLEISSGNSNAYFSVHVGSDIPFNYRDSDHWFSSNDYNPNHTYKYVINFSNIDEGLDSDILYDYWDIYLNIGGIEYNITPFQDMSVSVFIPGDRISTSYSFDWVLYNCANYVADDSNLAYLYVDYDFVIYDMGPSGDTQNHIANQTDQLTNGYDDSKGNQVNSDLSTGLNDYETAENSLFATATTGLNDFTFFDFESVPAMITGMSFIGSIMGSWFNQAGGASGVGIVLSILFSVILVAMVLGLYRWYQSRGGKN